MGTVLNHTNPLNRSRTSYFESFIVFCHSNSAWSDASQYSRSWKEK